MPEKYEELREVYKKLGFTGRYSSFAVYPEDFELIDEAVEKIVERKVKEATDAISTKTPSVNISDCDY